MWEEVYAIEESESIEINWINEEEIIVSCVVSRRDYNCDSVLFNR